MLKEPWLELASDLLAEVEQAFEQGLDIGREGMKAEAEQIMAFINLKGPARPDNIHVIDVQWCYLRTVLASIRV